MNHMEKINEAVGMMNRVTMGGGGGAYSLPFQKSRFLEIYWFRSIGSHLN